MSRMTYMSEEKKRNLFAEKAAKHFAENPKHYTFGDIAPGEYLAMRWGLGDDCVLVLKLDEAFEPVNYQQLILQVPKKSDAEGKEGTEKKGMK